MLRRAFLALCLCFAALPAAAQNEPPNALLLIAKPGMADVRFRDAVVLVTQTRDFSTVGVILNRPTDLKLQQLWPDAPRDGFQGPIYYGGPVMDQVIVTLFKSDLPPDGPAFHVLKDVYLAMHPKIVEPLLGLRHARMRVFAGFSGWAPRQLQSELERDGWFILPATEEVVFRRDTSGLWRELLDAALRKKAALYSNP
jgi:putative transcriptional regulator